MFVSACDEFPWAATNKGGRPETLLPDANQPHLRIIDWLNNSNSGSDYDTFADTWGEIADSQETFFVAPQPLVILATPLMPGGAANPAAPAIPSIAICSG